MATTEPTGRSEILTHHPWWARYEAECIEMGCDWPGAKSHDRDLSAYDHGRQHTEQTGHTVWVQRIETTSYHSLRDTEGGEPT